MALTPLSFAQVREVLSEVIAADHFFVSNTKTLTVVHDTLEEVPWEIFHGRLLDPAHTRLRRSFAAWNVFVSEGTDSSLEPVLSLKLEPNAGRVHVTRALLCHAWEGYHAGDNVYLSRETTRWVRELVGTVDVVQRTDRKVLCNEIAGLLFRAVVGTSRLPLTSLEAPLPAFSLGELGYFFHPDRSRVDLVRPMHSWAELIEQGLYAEQTWLEKARLLELLLRAVPAGAVSAAAVQFVARWQSLGHRAEELPALMRTLFNEVALSPYTAFVDTTLAFVRCLANNGPLSSANEVDFLGHLLRQLARHLTAYDLVTFHHGGANYPDALLLDAVLKAAFDLAERQPELFLPRAGDAEAQERQRRLRRRALRQGWLVRRRYEGHPVPDAPTSPGENARVLPPPYRRVPDEQLTNPARRTRRLYAGDPLATHLGPRARLVMQQSVQDLRHPAELQELGMAVFIERPLGMARAVGEPDSTLLLAHEAFSKTIAAQRLDALAHDPEFALDTDEGAVLRQHLRDLPVPGIALGNIAPATRAVVSLADARRMADDFVFLRTLPGSVAAFLTQFDLAPLTARFALDDLAPPSRMLIVRTVSPTAGPEGVLTIFHAALRRRLELALPGMEGRATAAGGLRVQRVWDAMGKEYDVTAEGILLAAPAPPPPSFSPPRPGA
jgi:hypothetical protein